MPFCYSNAKPPQLGYYDRGIYPVMLPFWFVGSHSTDHAERMIRAKAFGSIRQDAFFIRTWTWYNDFVSDSNSPKDDSNCKDIALFYPNSGYGNLEFPSGGIGRLQLGLS